MANMFGLIDSFSPSHGPWFLQILQLDICNVPTFLLLCDDIVRTGSTGVIYKGYGDPQAPGMTITRETIGLQDAKEFL